MTIQHIKKIRYQRGTALIETTLTLLVVLFLTGLCVEFAQAHQTRHLISLALQEAARVAAVTHANPAKWRPALTKGLRAIYASETAQHQHGQLTGRAGLAPYYIEILAPARARTAQNRVFTVKPRYSGQPTQDVLHLRLTYLYIPKQPWLGSAIRSMSRIGNPAQAGHPEMGAQARRAGFIPLVAEYKVLMQTDLPD
ncbi:MAG: TadE/TadG family type IV pilus assembly protein [Betaproteobacteria bacterium]